MHNGIQGEELDNFLAENIAYLEQSADKFRNIECALFNQSRYSPVDNNHININYKTTIKTGQNQKTLSGEWKRFHNNKQCRIYRRELRPGLHEYRLHASFDDITAQQLFTTCTDVHHRKKWDSYVANLNVVDENVDASAQLIHWVTRCPKPFATRDYVYLRRHYFDERNGAFVAVQRTTSETDIPIDPKVTRVDAFMSKTIVKAYPGKRIDEPGCHYLIVYFDDPKMTVPARVLDLAAAKGATDSLKRMHKAAVSAPNDW